MCSWLTRAAALATLILPGFAGTVAADEGNRAANPPRGHLVVEQLLDHREQLALDSTQTAELTRLAQRLRAASGRLRITGHRAPGKAGPRVERRPISPREALRRALRVLTPEQRVIATRLIRLTSADKAHR